MGGDMSDTCNYADCENDPDVRRKIKSGSEYQFCEEHDPLEDETVNGLWSKI